MSNRADKITRFIVKQEIHNKEQVMHYASSKLNRKPSFSKAIMNQSIMFSKTFITDQASSFGKISAIFSFMVLINIGIRDAPDR